MSLFFLIIYVAGILATMVLVSYGSGYSYVSISWTEEEAFMLFFMSLFWPILTPIIIVLIIIGVLFEITTNKLRRTFNIIQNAGHKKYMARRSGTDATV